MEELAKLPQLSTEEIRVLGVLMEKCVTTPDYYPMTLNGICNACNQKSARKPIVEYDEATVVLTLDTLKKRGLVSNEVGGLSRVAKYKHNFALKYAVDPAEVAVMCLLFLRGALTPGELKSNSGRLFNFESLEEVNQTLLQLEAFELPFIKQLPRRSGQKEVRFTHQFCEVNLAEEEDIPLEPARKSVNELEQRVSELEETVLKLKSDFEALYKELMG